MKLPLAFLLAVTGGWCAAQAQYDPLNAISVQSKSGQFTVVEASAKVPELATNDARFVVLDPNGLAVSCERVKQALWRELDVKDPWRGKVFITLRPAVGPDDEITILTERVREGWSYRLAMPNLIEPARVVRALVNVLLLELANRHADARSAEVPLWLAEGLTQKLLASTDIELVVPRPQLNVHGLRVTVTDVSGVLPNPLATVTNTLQHHPALTFQELSWPPEIDLNSEAGATYRASAQLFVTGLLEPEDGRASLRGMINKLPDYYNWQTAFLAAFGARFPRLLDVEKWWALQLAEFTSRDLNRLWTPEETWEKLDEVIRTPVEISHSEADLMVRREATLQRILRELNFKQQKEVLNIKLAQLASLRQFAAPALAGLVDDYENVLRDYLHRREKMDGSFLASLGLVSGNGILDGTLKSLDALDVRRVASNPKPATARSE